MKFKTIRIEDPAFLPELIKRLKAPQKKYTPEEMKEIYAALKEQFTAADLQKFTEPWDDAVLADELLESLQKKQNEFEGK